MNARALHHQLTTTSQANLSVKDDRLVVTAPEGALTAELVEQIKAHKPELMQLVQVANEKPRARCYTLTIDGKRIPVIASDADGSLEEDIISFKRRWNHRLTHIEPYDYDERLN